MGTFIVNPNTAFRMDTFTFDSYGHGNPTYGPTEVHIAYQNGGYTNLDGQFDYSTGTIEGTLQSIEDVSGSGVVNYQLFGISTDAHAFFEAVQASDEQAAFQLVFAGGDRMTGSSSADYLNGYDGRDTIEGGRGHDTLLGGNGNDTFYFQRASGNDDILDFSRNDKIQINVKGVNDMSDLTIVSDGHHGSIISWTNASVHINLNPERLRDGNFVFGALPTEGLASSAVHHGPALDAFTPHVHLDALLPTHLAIA